MKKFVSFALACLMLVSLLAFTVSAEKKPGEWTLEDVEELLNSFPRMPGEISVAFVDGMTEEEASLIFVDVGLPADLNDKTVYMENGLANNRNYVDVRISEDCIAEMILALCHHEGVYCVIPNWIEKADDPVNVGDLNGDNNIDAFDYMLLKSAVLGTYELNDNQRVLADVNCDGLVNAFDYQQLKYMVLH